jgi:hypothetical protein
MPTYLGLAPRRSSGPRNSPCGPESSPPQLINSLQPLGHGVPTRDGLGRQLFSVYCRILLHELTNTGLSRFESYTGSQIFRKALPRCRGRAFWFDIVSDTAYGYTYGACSPNGIPINQ